MTRTVVVGEVMLDVSAPLARAESIVHGPIRVEAGGTAVHGASGAARVGSAVTVVGKIGDDVAGIAVRSELQRRGIDARLAVDRDRPTGTFLRMDAEDASAIAVDRGASAALTSADVVAAGGAEVVLVSGYVLLHDDTAPAGLHALELGNGALTGVTAGSIGLIRRAGAGTFRRRSGRAGVLFANSEEASALSGLDHRSAIDALLETYPLVVVTDGPREVVARGRDGEAAATPAPSSIDPGVGAGDRLAGAMLAALGRGDGLDAALQLGCAAAQAGAR